MRQGLAMLGLLGLAAVGPAWAEEVPGLTAAEMAGFRAAVQSCWAIEHLPWDARRTVVTLGFELDRSGRVLGEVRLVSGEGDDAAVAVAFANARTALLLCQGDGYDLPQAKHEQWRQVELTFDPRELLG
jgi:hypothetical protein